MSITLAHRDEMKKEDTWQLEDIFATDQACEQLLQKVKKQCKDFEAFKGKLTTDPSLLLDFLTLQDEVGVSVGKVYVYAHMRLHQDGNISYYQDLSSQSESLSVEVSEALSFANPELITLSPSTLAHFYQVCPKLTHYKRYLDEVLRQKEHILSPDLEALMARVSEIGNLPSNAFSMLNNVDITFPIVKNTDGEAIRLTHGQYVPLMESKKQSVRRGAFTALYETYASYKNTLATLFAGNVKQYGFFASMHHYVHPLDAALSENNIPTAVYHNLIKTVNQRLNFMYDYVELRQETLGLNELHMYDLFVPMVKDFEKKISFEEACSILLKALAPLGEEYLEVVKEALHNRWIDKYENKGKRSGAYSWGTYGAPHPYILLNYTENISSLFTLAHEMGHAMHTYFSHKHQSATYGDYCIFVAEVASTVNEALLMQYLLKTTEDKNFRLYLINYFMEQFRSTLYRQTMFAEFELDMHSASQAGKTLTPEFLCNHYYSLVKKYHGDHMVVDEAIAMEWARIPHFYTPFYVYQYATGYSAAITLSEKILKEGTPAVQQYIKFLSGGSSQDPIDLLKIAGVDMSKAEPINNALDLFGSLINDFKQIIK